MNDVAPAVEHPDLVRRAEALHVDVLVYVTAPHRPAPTAATAPPAACRIMDGPAAAEAESAGREWFSAAPDASCDDTAVSDNRVLVPLRDPDAGVLGVVVASVQSPLFWTAQEQLELQRMIESHALEIESRAAADGHPHLAEHPPASRGVDDFAAELREAVLLDELRLDYQPEIDLPSGRVVALEALVRWRHPRLGELGPEWFISLAEHSDLITLVGDWVLEHAVTALASWTAALPGLDVVLRVNVSPVQLESDDLYASIAATLERHGVAGRQLCIELTESMPLVDSADVARSIARLKELGVTSAIDDLAIGYSALSRLRTLPVDAVKIDRSLVCGIDSDERAQTILTALIGLAMGLRLGIVAEGVETEAEAATLVALGCVRAQGHHLGRPMTADAVRDLLTAEWAKHASGNSCHIL